MERIPVTSSNVRSVGYDAQSEVLEIEFHDNSIYHYSGVPRPEYDGLMSASSKGKYFSAQIKGRYPYTRI